MSNMPEIVINRSGPTGTVTPPGNASIATLPVTPLSGDPAINVQIGASTINPFGFGTAFGTDCDGYFFPNTYVIGDASDPCGASNGIAGDWFDADGALSVSGNTPPAIYVPGTA